MDIKSTKGKFTWSNRRLSLGHIIAQLDQFLIQNDFLLDNTIISSKIILSSISYHNPITLVIQDSPYYGPLPFRFNPLWLQDPKSIEIISTKWKNWIIRDPINVSEQKLKLVKTTLKNWAK